MPVNLLHSLLHRVETGWDPISSTYAEEYERHAAGSVDLRAVEKVEALCGGLNGKRALDLGGGPGQYGVLFAKRGATVTWHDVSREYEKKAKNRAASEGVTLEFSLGYLEEAKKFGEGAFDVVFCRVCWYYCRSDRAFAQLIYSLLKPGGVGYIECNTPAFSNPRGWRWLQQALNTYLWWKVGHPMPPHGRIARLLQNYATRRLEVDYSSELRDIVVFVKC
jgi:SAM-dependent methyltransferase